MICHAHNLRSAWLGLLLATLGACSQSIDYAELRAETGDAPVVVLSTSTCGYCSRLRSDLEDWNVEFKDLDVESNSQGRRAYDLVNGRGVPILLIGEQVLHGYSPDKARQMLVDASLLADTTNQ